MDKVCDAFGCYFDFGFNADADYFGLLKLYND